MQNQADHYAQEQAECAKEQALVRESGAFAIGFVTLVIGILAVIKLPEFGIASWRFWGCLALFLLVFVSFVSNVTAAVRFHKRARQFQSVVRTQKYTLQVANVSFLKELRMGVGTRYYQPGYEWDKEHRLRKILPFRSFVGVEVTDLQGNRYRHYFLHPLLNANFELEAILQKLRGTVIIELYEGTDLICAFDPPLL